VNDRLEGVVEEIRRIVVSDFPTIEDVNQYLRLMPANFCVDLSSCAIQGLQLGIVAGF